MNPTPTLTVGSTTCSANLQTYTINFTSNGTVTSTAGTVSGNTVTGITQGTNVTLTSSLNGCTATLPVTAPSCTCPSVAAPTNATASPTTICVGGSSILSANCANGATLSWYANAGLTNALPSATVSPTATRSYYAVCTVDANGCKSQATSVQITVVPQPTLSLSASSTLVTVGTPVSLSAIGCTGNVSWSTGQTGSVITVTPANATNTYSATCTTGPGCTATASITVNTQPVVSCAVTATVTPGNCMSATNTYSATVAIQLTSAPTGVLTVSAGNSSMTLATTSSVTAYTTTLTGLVSDGAMHTVGISLAGCSSFTTTYTAPVSCTPASCPPPVHVCKGSGYIYQLSTTPNLGTYQWYHDGTVISGATSSTYNATQAGSYSVVVNGNVVGACPDNSCCPVIIVEDSIPVYQAHIQTATCQPQSNSVNSDGRLLITNWSSGSTDTATYYYEVTLGPVYNASQLVAGGSTTSVPPNGVLVANLPNPSSSVGQAYTIRVTNGSGCYRDEVVTLSQTVCSCPPAKCVPFVIKRVK